MKKLAGYRGGDIVYYLLSVVPFFLAANAGIYEGMAGLAAGLYTALVFCRCNYFLVSPMFLAGSALADASLQGIVCAAAPIAVMGAAKLIHYLSARPMGLFAANVYAFAGQLPSFAFVPAGYELRFAIASVAANQLFCYCALLICYALIVRGVRNKLTTDETVGGAVVVMILSLGLYRLDIYSFMPFFAVLGWTVMVSLRSFSVPAALLIVFSMGMGGSIASLDMSVCGAAVAAYVAACAFKKLHVLFPFAAMMLSDLLAGAFFEAFAYTPLHIAALAAGGLCYVLLPKKLKARIAVYTPENRIAGAKRLLSHGRAEVFARLNSVANVFYEMGKSFSVRTDRPENRLPAPQEVARDVMLTVCAGCPRREGCQAALGGDTSSLFVPAASSALLTGDAGAADMPTFVTSRCCRIDALLAGCKSAAERYKKREENAKRLDLSQRVIAEQMYGVGNMISDVAEDVNKGISFDERAENRLIEELSYKNIVCTEAVLYTKEGKIQASLTVRRADARKRALDETVSAVLGNRMQRVGEAQPLGSDKVTLSFAAAPRYCAVFGEASVRKSDSADNGDSRAVRKLAGGKLFVAVCDGMGSGAEAQANSSSTLAMVENFYKAGFGNEAALNMINRMLMMKGADEFSALDICVIDLETAIAHFVKLGGVQSFVKRADNVDVIESSALPIGIVEEATPYSDSRLLSGTDSVVLVSDGIVDALGADGVRLVLSRTDTLSPQELCDTLLAKATEYGAKDDSTAVAVRLIAG